MSNNDICLDHLLRSSVDSDLYLGSYVESYFKTVLRGLNARCRFSAIFGEGDNYCDLQFAFLCAKPLLKRDLL